MTTTPTNVLASVDLGSNSFRLQVCENNNGQLKVIDSFKQIVHFAFIFYVKDLPDESDKIM